MSLLILFALIALVVSFFCSVTEAVLLSVTPSYVASMEKKKLPVGKRMRGLKEDMNRPLSAILTLNTIANTVGAAGVGAQAATVFGSGSVGIVSGILTLLILVFSEIIPKNIGASYWRQLAPIVAVFLKWLVIVLFPFVLISKWLTSGFKKSSHMQSFTREEFAAMADLSAQEGQLEAKESRILKNLFRFRSSTIKNIMTPRTVVFAMQENMTIEDFFRIHHQTAFSRIPIYNRDRDDITGFVLKDEVMLAQARSNNESRLREFKRDITVISSSSSLSQLFEFLLNRREHIVLVVDEYGGMEGIVTLEDVVETLLGLEIVDEADKTVDMQALARTMWEKRAKKMGLETESAQNNGTYPGEESAPKKEADVNKEDTKDAGSFGQSGESTDTVKPNKGEQSETLKKTGKAGQTSKDNKNEKANKNKKAKKR